MFCIFAFARIITTLLVRNSYTIITENNSVLTNLVNLLRSINIIDDDRIKSSGDKLVSI